MLMHAAANTCPRWRSSATLELYRWLVPGMVLQFCCLGCDGVSPAVPKPTAPSVASGSSSPVEVSADKENPSSSRVSDRDVRQLENRARGEAEQPFAGGALGPAHSAEVQELLANGWTPEAASSVLDLNERWFKTLVDDGRMPDMQLLVERLASLGAEPGVPELLQYAPELGGLFLVLPADALLAVFRDAGEEELPLLAALLLRAIDADQGTQMLSLLAERDLRKLAIDLQRKGFVGAESLLLASFNSVDNEYLYWLRDELSAATRVDDRERLSSLVVVHSVFGHKLRTLFRDEPQLAARIRSEFWPALYELSLEKDTAIEMYLLDEHLWQMMEMPSGQTLIRKFGPMASLPFFGHQAWPESLHSRLTQIMCVCGPVAAEFVLNNRFRNSAQMHELLSSTITPEQCSNALSRIAASQQPSDELAYLTSLNTRVLQNELRGDEGGDFDWIPLVPTFGTVGKWMDGRRVTGWEWAEVAVDVGSTILMVTPTGPIAHTAKVGTGARAVGATNVATRTLARTGLVGAAGSGARAATAPAALMSTLHTGAAVRRVAGEISEAVVKGATVDVTDCVRSFYKSAGFNRKSFQGLTGLNPKVFMQPNGRVLFHIDRAAVNNAERFFKATRIARADDRFDESMRAASEEMSAMIFSYAIDFSTQ